MPKVESKFQIIEATQHGDVTSVMGRFDSLDNVASHPLAPAGLYSKSLSGEKQFQLHKLVWHEGELFRFETYGQQMASLPTAGQVFFFRPWWMPKALQVVLDVDANWIRKDYPDNGDHSHCLFTWETISWYSGERAGYWSEKYGWTTVTAYEDFIAKDIYRLRS
jgi:hypothetical protein